MNSIFLLCLVIGLLVCLSNGAGDCESPWIFFLQILEVLEVLENRHGP